VQIARKLVHPELIRVRIARAKNTNRYLGWLCFSTCWFSSMMTPCWGFVRASNTMVNNRIQTISTKLPVQAEDLDPGIVPGREDAPAREHDSETHQMRPINT